MGEDTGTPRGMLRVAFGVHLEDVVVKRVKKVVGHDAERVLHGVWLQHHPRVRECDRHVVRRIEDRGWSQYTPHT